MSIIGISGMPGSGKSIVSEIATENGAIIVSMGDIIREEAKKRGEGSKETATNLRKEHGQYIVSELTIKKIKKLREDGIENPIVVEGIRSHHEVEMFKENFDNFIIVSVFANANLRFERLKQRKREDDSQDYEGFQKRDFFGSIKVPGDKKRNDRFRRKVRAENDLVWQKRNTCKCSCWMVAKVGWNHEYDKRIYQGDRIDDCKTVRYGVIERWKGSGYCGSF